MVTSPQGRTWSLQPHTAGLSSAEGGFETSLGWYGVQWAIQKSASGSLFSISIETPEGTSGTVRFPFQAAISTLDGKAVGSSGKGDTISLTGGKHTISMSI